MSEEKQAADWSSMRERMKEQAADPAKVGKRELWKAIREYCLECSGEQYSEVRRCACDGSCKLFKYRFGKPPAKVKGVDLDGRLLKEEPCEEEVTEHDE